jgi:hypothetical protein
MFCAACGSPVPDANHFCPRCGAALAAAGGSGVAPGEQGRGSARVSWRRQFLEQYLEPGEQIVWQGRQSPLSILLRTTLAGFGMVTLFYLPFVLSVSGAAGSGLVLGVVALTWLGGCLAASAVFGLMGMMYLQWARRFALTNRRIVSTWRRQKAVWDIPRYGPGFAGSFDQVAGVWQTTLSNVTGVAVRQGPFARRFGYGSVVITAKNGWRVTFSMVPHPHAVRRAIEEQMAAV